ncbi:MAG: DUF559 domain-containing protein [Sphingorhabdus sp.]
MLQGGEGGKKRARQLRQEASLPEALLWQRLKAGPVGLKFRRQHPSGPYIADFYCHKAKLIVEVDGIAHDVGDNPQQDLKRDAWFAERKLEVIRIPAKEVLQDVDRTAQSIVEYAAGKAKEK